MVMMINTNVPSLMAQKQLGKTQDLLAQTLCRLSSGQGVNHAKDDASMAALDTAITTLTTGLSNLGIAHSNIESAVQGSEINAVMSESARSQMMDVDFASESAKMSQLQIFQQAGTAMRAQANASAQVVLKLIQG